MNGGFGICSVTAYMSPEKLVSPVSNHFGGRASIRLSNVTWTWTKSGESRGASALSVARRLLKGEMWVVTDRMEGKCRNFVSHGKIPKVQKS